MFNLDLTEVVITVIQLIFALGVAYLGKLAHNKQKSDGTYQNRCRRSRTAVQEWGY